MLASYGTSAQLELVDQPTTMDGSVEQSRLSEVLLLYLRVVSMHTL
jgi:hypothetical protein